MTDGADRLQVAILGAFEARVGGQPILIRGGTERALLACLALDGNLPVSNDRITDGLWGDQAPRRPKQAIHALIFRLRRALGESATALRTADGGYCLHLGPDDLDLWRFEALAAAGRDAEAGGDLEAAARHLTGALALWRGDPLTGLEGYPFAVACARRLDESRFETLVQRIGVDLARGRHSQLIPELEALAVGRPAHEDLCRLLMIALYRSGRQVDALAVYDRLRKGLADQFGIDPSPPLQALEVGILRQDAALGWPPAATRRASQPESQRERQPEPRAHHELGRGRLPYPLTSFIGRDAELADVIALARRHRLVTIAGPGGCGKTRLAIEAGHRLTALGVEVRFVRLEGLTDPALVPVAVAEAAGIRLGAGQSASAELTGALADRDLLIVLDNGEHLLTACADLVIAVLEAAPSVRFLLTSREHLSVPGEVVRRLASLAAPQPGEPDQAIASADAVRLFLDRAATAIEAAAPRPTEPHPAEPSGQPDLAAPSGSATPADPAGLLGAGALVAVGEICRRLDGIPLALELAAARLVTLSLDQLSERLADRFGVLRGESRAGRARHRTLQAAMAWSHDLLAEPERCLFRRLSVFASAFPLEAAETVCADATLAAEDVCDLLARLVSKSLVTVERDDGEVEYRLLSTIREYAGCWLTDPAERYDLARRHHDWCLAQATQAARAVYDGDQRRWARRKRSRVDDIRAALDWALGPGGGTGALAAAMWPIWEMWSQDLEGRQWVARALARDQGIRPAERASLLLGAAVFARDADDYDAACQFLDQASAAYRDLADDAGEARCRLERGRVCLETSQLDQATRCAADVRQAYRDLADEWGVAWSDVLAGNVLMVRGEYQAAAGVLNTALEAGRRIDNPALVGDTLIFLGLVTLRGGQPDGAVPYLEEALGIGRMIGNDSLVNAALAHLGVVAGRQGQRTRALALLDEALVMARQRGEPVAVARILLESGEIAGRQGEHARSQALAREALRVYRRVGAFIPVPQCFGLLATTALELGQPSRAATLLAAADRARRDLGLPPASAAPAPEAAAADAGEWQRGWEHGAGLSLAGAIRFALDES